MNDYKTSNKDTWNDAPAGTTHALELKPGTKDFFTKAYNARENEEIPWLSKVFDFKQSKEKKVLEIGHGAGFDAYTFLKNGATYFGIDLAENNTKNAKLHLNAMGFNDFTLINGSAEELPFKDNMFDIVFSNGVLHHIPNFEKCINEISRVLKPTGVGCILVYNKNSIFYFLSLYVFSYLIKKGYKVETMQDRLSKIEYNTVGAKPYVKVYTRNEIRKSIKKAGLKVVSVKIRKLKREDFPPTRIIEKLVSLVPQRLLDAIGRFLGWYLILTFQK